MSSVKSPAGYGSLPFSPAAENPPTMSNPSILERAKITTQSLIATQRPWGELFDPSSFSLPLSYDDAMARIQQNVRYFRVNYTFAMLLMVFLSLFWNPISMIVFLLIFVAWLYLYFSRDQPLVIFNYTFDDKIVVGFLGLVTIIALVSTDVGSNVLWSLITGVIVVGLHAAFRNTADHFLDEASAAEGGLISVAGNRPSGQGFSRV